MENFGMKSQDNVSFPPAPDSAMRHRLLSYQNNEGKIMACQHI